MVIVWNDIGGLGCVIPLSKVQGYWYSDLFMVPRMFSLPTYQLTFLHCSALVLKCGPEHWIVSTIWVLVGDQEHEPQGKTGTLFRRIRSHVTIAKRIPGRIGVMHMCQPRARDQQSILLKAHWSFDILLIIPSQINQARQAATLRDILLVCNIWLYKEPWNLMQLFVWQEGHSSILFGQQNLGGKSAQIALIKSWNKTA